MQIFPSTVRKTGGQMLTSLAVRGPFVPLFAEPITFLLANTQEIGKALNATVHTTIAHLEFVEK